MSVEAGEKKKNSLPICSGVMPMPVSTTAIVIQSQPFSCCSRASMLMSPRSVNLLALLFFFQAEDGIRDYKVTGVQTCALPISLAGPRPGGRAAVGRLLHRRG